MRSFKSMAAAGLLMAGLATAQSTNLDIRLNQMGYYPKGPKLVSVIQNGDPLLRFAIVRASNLSDTVFKDTLSGIKYWAPAEDSVRRGDFTKLEDTGTFRIAVPGLGVSGPFRIAPDVLQPVFHAGMKAFYYQRASMALAAEFAGNWARPAGHPDNAVTVHVSAAGPVRAGNSTFSSPGGWYDAGDYGKYIVNCGVTMYNILSLLELFPDYLKLQSWNIPESRNNAPDLLDEALYNLRWMLTMQDPADGGVYHKLTTANFSGSVMPDGDKAVRYAVHKSSTATWDFAAVTAQAARILKKDYESFAPGLADSCLTASRKAWQWASGIRATNGRDSLYNQDSLNKYFSRPKVTTGTYGDGNANDERYWAAMELYVTTKEDSFRVATFDGPWSDKTPRDSVPRTFGSTSSLFSLQDWPNVRTLSMFTAAIHADLFPQHIDTAVVTRIRVLAASEYNKTAAATNNYVVPLGPNDFGWGSNARVANAGIASLYAYYLTDSAKYLRTAQFAMDYLLGRNATSYSFVTGLGSVQVFSPHHRPSQADAVSEPIPGLLVGGPNAQRNDGCDYWALQPAKSYIDDDCSYASNEVAINWNAPLAHLSAALDAVYNGHKSSIQQRVGISPRGPRRNLGGAALSATLRGNALDFGTSRTAIERIELLDASGRVAFRSEGADAGRFELPKLGNGLLVVRVHLEGDAGIWIARMVQVQGGSGSQHLSFRRIGD